jgi:hypothetical protein
VNSCGAAQWSGLGIPSRNSGKRKHYCPSDTNNEFAHVEPPSVSKEKRLAQAKVRVIARGTSRLRSSSPAINAPAGPEAFSSFRHLTIQVSFAIESARLAGARFNQGGGCLPADPSQCRQHARRCAELARTANTPETREHFANLASSWLNLAKEVEGAQAFLRTMDEIEAEELDSEIAKIPECSGVKSLSAI